MAEGKKYILSTAGGMSNEVVQIGERDFSARPFTLRETDALDASLSFAEQIKNLAGPLTARALDDEPVTSDFLLDNITRPFLKLLMSLYINGTLEADPKA